jgi:type I restriction enzyme S subunit
MFDEEMITWSIDGGGRLFYRPKHKFSVTNVGGTLRVLNPKVLEIRFLHRALENLHSRKVFDWVFKAHPSVIRMVYDEIPVPPLKEQNRIVELLDTATASVTEITACYEQARTNVGNLLASALRSEFEGIPDWPVKTLGEIGVVKGGKRLPKGTPWSEIATSHPYIRATDIRDGQIRTDGLVYVPNKIWPVISRYTVEEGDVLITIAGTIGSVAEVPRELSGANLTENAAKITNLQGLIPAYLSYFLRSPDVKEQLENLATTTTQAKLALFRIETIQLSVPPLEEQKKIVARLDSIRSKTSEMVAAYDAKLQVAKNLRQSILEAAFAGEL